jgi:hypothetical protein
LDWFLKSGENINGKTGNIPIKSGVELKVLSHIYFLFLTNVHGKIKMFIGGKTE